jgi:hypothetical protein
MPERDPNEAAVEAAQPDPAKGMRRTAIDVLLTVTGAIIGVAAARFILPYILFGLFGVFGLAGLGRIQLAVAPAIAVWIALGVRRRPWAGETAGLFLLGWVVVVVTVAMDRMTDALFVGAIPVAVASRLVVSWSAAKQRWSDAHGLFVSVIGAALGFAAAITVGPEIDRAFFITSGHRPADYYAIEPASTLLLATLPPVGAFLALSVSRSATALATAAIGLGLWLIAILVGAISGIAPVPADTFGFEFPVGTFGVLLVATWALAHGLARWSLDDEGAQPQG